VALFSRILCVGICVSVILSRCSSTPSPVPLSAEAPAVAANDSGKTEERARPEVTVSLPQRDLEGENVVTVHSATEKESVEQFAYFVLSDHPVTEARGLINHCRANESARFCYTVLHRDELEAKRRARLKKTRGTQYGKGNGRPVFQNGQISNWEKLRGASVNSLIRNLKHLADDKLKLMKEQALAYPGCPNNAAIAVAATLEDFLPGGADPAEISTLYEKGAVCIPQSPADQEILYTRAGLFRYLKNDYATAARLFETAAEIDVPYVGRALYWLSRAKKELNEDPDKIIEQLRTRYPFSFHTVVALTASKTDPGELLQQRNVANSARRSQRNPVVNQLIDEVELLKQNGFSLAAARVLDWAVAESQGFEPEVRMYLAELKQDSPDHLGRISLLSDILYRNPHLVSRSSLEMYFPKAFYPTFTTNTAGLDPHLLLAVARQESAFNARAVSSANARGLLQILPKTGRRFRRAVNLFDPESNIDVGSRYLYELLSQLNGNIYMALAAYNAGPERVSTWTTRYQVSEPVLFIDLIPFRETREYVASVLRNYYWYRRLNLQEDEGFVDLLFQTSLPSQNDLPVTSENR
jgi:soluble lytic murein transglycosylase